MGALRKRLPRVGLRVFLALLAPALVALALVPSPIDPLAFEPPPAPALAGPLAPNEALRQAELLAPGTLHGPEDLAFDASGRLYAATAEGAIVRLDEAGQPKPRARTSCS